MNTDDTFDGEDLEQKKIIDTYNQKGYLKSKDDIENLHRLFSPYKVPKGLTRLQIRRKINKFVKNGSKLYNPYENTHRVNIYIDDKFLSGTTYGKPITNHKEFVQFLKGLLKVLQSKKTFSEKDF